MTSLRFNITISLDGYVAGPKQSVSHPLGEGHDLHKWAFAVRTFRELHGMEGGTIGPDDAIPLPHAGLRPHASSAPHRSATTNIV